jgi:hypothetical protein
LTIFKTLASPASVATHGSVWIEAEVGSPFELISHRHLTSMDDRASMVVPSKVGVSSHGDTVLTEQIMLPLRVLPATVRKLTAQPSCQPIVAKESMRTNQQAQPIGRAPARQNGGDHGDRGVEWNPKADSVECNAPEKRKRTKPHPVTIASRWSKVYYRLIVAR